MPGATLEDQNTVNNSEMQSEMYLINRNNALSHSLMTQTTITRRFIFIATKDSGEKEKGTVREIHALQ